MIPTPLPPSLALVLVAFAALAAADALDPRADLRAAQAALDAAVGEVSQPSVHFVLGGREAARGYRVKGVGAFFVLPPRALPTRERGRVLLLERGAAPGFGPRLSDEQEQEFRAMQAQLASMQREAEAMQQEAERGLESVERNLRIRLEAPRPPAAPVPAEPPQASLPPSPPVADAPPPPPWRFWFGTSETHDDRPPDRVIADVQDAVTAALEHVGAGLNSLSADESVVVAVDFLPNRAFAFDGPAGPMRSLIVKVKKRDLLDRSNGKISAEELRRRIDYTQY
jgi:hypothetical protein